MSNDSLIDDTFFETLTEEQAKKIASMMFDATKSLVEYIAPNNDPKTIEELIEDHDYWYGIANNWDVSIYAGTDGLLHCCLFPVINGNTDTDHPIRVDTTTV
jgi:acyl-homoserine lactone acylase PvdQ